MTPQEVFAYRLRNIRTINNHTQEYVGRILGVSHLTVHNFENNTYRTHHKSLDSCIDKLVEHYGVHRSYFIMQPVKEVKDLLMNPYLDFWVWSWQMTYEKARELEKTLPIIC